MGPASLVPLVEFGPIRLNYVLHLKGCLSVCSFFESLLTDSILSTLVWWNQSMQRQQARWWHSCLSLAWLLELDFLLSSPWTSNPLINHSEDHSRGLLSERLVLSTWSLTSNDAPVIAVKSFCGNSLGNFFAVGFWISVLDWMTCSMFLNEKIK